MVNPVRRAACNSADLNIPCYRSLIHARLVKQASVFQNLAVKTSPILGRLRAEEYLGRKAFVRPQTAEIHHISFTLSIVDDSVYICRAQ